MIDFDVIDSTKVLPVLKSPSWMCICGQIYPVQEMRDFLALLRGTCGRVTNGVLRIRTFCTAEGCGKGLIEIHYSNEVVVE